MGLPAIDTLKLHHADVYVRRFYQTQRDINNDFMTAAWQAAALFQAKISETESQGIDKEKWGKAISLAIEIGAAVLPALKIWIIFKEALKKNPGPIEGAAFAAKAEAFLKIDGSVGKAVVTQMTSSGHPSNASVTGILQEALTDLNLKFSKCKDKIDAEEQQANDTLEQLFRKGKGEEIYQDVGPIPPYNSFQFIEINKHIFLGQFFAAYTEAKVLVVADVVTDANSGISISDYTAYRRDNFGWTPAGPAELLPPVLEYRDPTVRWDNFRVWCGLSAEQQRYIFNNGDCKTEPYWKVVNVALLHLRWRARLVSSKEVRSSPAWQGYSKPPPSAFVDP